MPRTEEPHGIIILEGADCTGKTSLAKALGGVYVHNGLYEDVWTAHLACVDEAVARCAEELVVIDRLFISEQVYGQVFRGGPAYDPEPLDEMLTKASALTVLCVRADQLRHLRHFDELKTLRRESFDDIARVVRLYADLSRGDLTKTGYTWLDREIRYGQYAQRPDVMLYDMDQMGMEQAARLVRSRLKGLHRFAQTEDTSL